MPSLALSFVIPLYKSADTIAGVVRDIEALKIDGGHEIILVNDGSGDRTGEVCRELVKTARIPITYIEHARNYGEHNAVLTGWRHATGAHVVNLDDDGQNPPAEAARLWEEANERASTSCTGTTRKSCTRRGGILAAASRIA
jgi:undecaprenyl-phosphate 4-deoxy-4-formamido-L-arabinose transferase